ncbi:hypothetical protein [Anaerosalibacter bizertensis]|uniref:hypothetical protein n=1 Tax=Anaerosalibacter bizertensis TaxID=932217 RepID=UPI002F25F71D
MESQCDNSNETPANWKLDNGGLFGFSNLHGNHWGGQAPVIHLMPKLYEMIKDEVFNPTEIAYKVFDQKKDNNIKVVFKQE